MIADLHFNENSSRPSATTKEGDLQYKISFPKFKHGDYSVRKKSVDPIYGKHIYLPIDDLLIIKQQCVRFIYFYFDINAKSNSLLCTVCLNCPLYFRIYINPYAGDTICGKRSCDDPVPCLPAVQPPPLCSGFIHPEKEDAILHFQSRFASRQTTV